MRNVLFNYLTLTVIYLTIIVVVLNQFMSHSLVNFCTWTELVLMIISLFFFTLAKIRLGKAFQASAAAHRLVKEGIY